VLGALRALCEKWNLAASTTPPMLTAFACEAGRPVLLTSPDHLASAVWIDLRDPTQEESRLVTEATGLHVPTQHEVSEIEASSRLALRENVLYLSMPLISMTDGPRAVSAGFVLSPQRLLTVRFATSLVFDAFTKRMPDGEEPHETGAHVLFGLLAAIVDRQADAMERIHADLDTISHRVFSLAGEGRAGRKIEDRILRDTLGQLGRIGDLISHIRESLLGVTRLLPFIEANTTDWLPKDLHPKLATLREDAVSISDFDNHMTDKLQFLLDATLGFINIAQNDVMKVMTIASVVGIPPVLIAGVYGMNFKLIPEYDWSWGYPYAWGMIVLTTLIPLAIFRWRKWI
jgi:magnesium transporter